MVEISDATKAKLWELTKLAKSKPNKKMTLKARRGEEAKMLLHATGVRHTDKCYRCLLNCEVVRTGDSTHWAVQEGIEACYTRETCPKQTETEKKGIKRRKTR